MMAGYSKYLTMIPNSQKPWEHASYFICLEIQRSYNERKKKYMTREVNCKYVDYKIHLSSVDVKALYHFLELRLFVRWVNYYYCLWKSCLC